MRRRGMALLAVTSSVFLTITHAWADDVPQSKRGLIRKCPEGSTASVVGGKLKCSLTFACDSGYEAVESSDGLICFRRENALAAADCNDCHAGAHVQEARAGRDTCKLGGVGGSEPNKLRCCNNATRWQDKDGTLDVCGFFAAPKPQ